MAGRRCSDGGDLAVPSDHRLQGTASELLGAWQGRRKRQPLGAGWESRQVCPKPPSCGWLHCKVAPGWHPAVIQDVLAAVGISG